MQILTLPDGRKLAYCFYGNACGTPLFYFHGSGSSRLEASYSDGYARDLGLRLIAVDRPGFGHSSPTPTPGFSAFAADVLQLADALGLDHFSVAGMSAGGPHALHLALAAPSRVQAVFLINSSSDARHPAFAASPWWLRVALKFVASPPALKRMVTKLKADPAGVSAKPAQREGWNQEQVSRFAAVIEEGLRQEGSIAAMREEAHRVVNVSWQLDWAKITCPIIAMCGERDPGRWFYQRQSELLPNLTFIRISGGHQPYVERAAWEQLAGIAKESSACRR